ncbi:hypothetical protein [Avibacterium paragallinarum]|uniref:Uncharacterized protein n=1 Tax=Avibacterium paragallinarum TaxID=728 RepID=A0A380X257_AVIPA|nr:hypothetical protein [Avibacterium paragallinarum]SUU97335.1 Uncharacterised protein [Avibacterium paragallinarum]
MNDSELARAYDDYSDRLLEEHYREDEQDTEEPEIDEDDDFCHYHCIGAGGL